MEVLGLSTARSVGGEFIVKEHTNGNPQVRVGCNTGERALGGEDVGGLRQSTAHEGHSKHVWSCLVTNLKIAHLIKSPHYQSHKVSHCIDCAHTGTNVCVCSGAYKYEKLIRKQVYFHKVIIESSFSAAPL